MLINYGWMLMLYDDDDNDNNNNNNDNIDDDGLLNENEQFCYKLRDINTMQRNIDVDNVEMCKCLIKHINSNKNYVGKLSYVVSGLKDNYQFNVFDKERKQTLSQYLEDKRIITLPLKNHEWIFTKRTYYRNFVRELLANYLKERNSNELVYK